MSHLYRYARFTLRCFRALNPRSRATKITEKTVRYGHRRFYRATLARQPYLQAEANAKSARGLLLLTTVLAASLDENDEQFPPPSDLENVTTIKKVTDLEALLFDAGDKLVVIFCMVRWCPFCRKITPTVEDIAAKGSENVVILKLDMDDEEAESSRIVARYEAYNEQHGRFAVGLPTFVFIKEGAKIDHFSSSDDRKLRGAVARYI